MKIVLKTLTKDEHLAKFDTTKMINSTTVSIYLTFFDWAKFQSTNTGINIHTSIDGSIGIPNRVIFSNVACHDRIKMDKLMTHKGTIYICDKGYVGYKKFDTYATKGIYFVSHLKDNNKITVTDELPITYSEEKMGFSPKVVLSFLIEKFA